MPKLKLGPLADTRPVKLTLELPAALHRDLAAYAELLARETGQEIKNPAVLIAAMLESFMASDKEFQRIRRAGK